MDFNKLVILTKYTYLFISKSCFKCFLSCFLSGLWIVKYLCANNAEGHSIKWNFIIIIIIIIIISLFAAKKQTNLNYKNQRQMGRGDLQETTSLIGEANSVINIFIIEL